MRAGMLWTFVRRAAVALLLVLSVVAAAVMFFDQQRRARETRAATDAAPRNGRFVDAGDVRIFVQEAGPANAPAVLLVHGTGTWSEIWRETIEALAPDHHVIAIDLPPFGYSDKPMTADAYARESQARRIVAVLDALHVDTVTLVGHSVGARPVVEAALRAPGRVARLILVDPALGFQADGSQAPHFEQNHPSWAMRTLFGTPSLRSATISTYGTNPIFMHQMFGSFVSNKAAVTPQRLDVILRPMVVKGTTAAYGAWLSMLTTAGDRSESSDFANLKHLQMPVRIIWGRTDAVTPLWQGERLRDLIPGSQLVVLEGVGHIPYIEDPPRFNSALRELVTR